MAHPAAVLRIGYLLFGKSGIHVQRHLRPRQIIQIIQPEHLPQIALWNGCYVIIHGTDSFLQLILQDPQLCDSLFQHGFYRLIFRYGKAGDLDRPDGPVLPGASHGIRNNTLFPHSFQPALIAVNPIPEILDFLPHLAILYQNIFRCFHWHHLLSFSCISAQSAAPAHPLHLPAAFWP